ncbi:resistance to Congo red protein [Sulfurospirillum tamanense]|nr:resistance to Congo red protein [Sulfurospirillum tamanensis]
MLNLAQPVSLWVVFGAIGAVVLMIGVGIMLVNKKRIKDMK